jgi:acyl dehydratase
MTTSIKHVFEQGPVIAAMGKAALAGLRPKAATSPFSAPGRWIEAELPPRPEGLIRDYVRNVGGDPAAYRGRLPAHMFPQWGFPLAAQAMGDLPYPLVRVMNAGCRIEQHAPLPAHEALRVKARIESIDDDGRRVVITQRIVTGTKSAPEAVVADLRAFVPLGEAKNGANGKSKSNGAPAKPKAHVPEGAREIAYLRLPANAGLDFAKLTGDFNPIHWVPAYARASGFKGVILHGFGSLARAIEALNRGRFAGDVTRLSVIDAKFTRPLVLPAKVGVYVGPSGEIWIGDAPGGAAYLEGRFEGKATT